ncbi:hypothetical protein [Klebsiella quasipneumoniae]|uniref:hypothetical protein n=1 Tax=Klebsiella quasipneumoniae TaxID=1463165 RepID=UPI000A1CC3A6|nr:hypothetical protein [Klebsiella quasipneumoniae]
MKLNLKKVSLFVLPIICLALFYSLLMGEQSLLSFKQKSVRALSLSGDETSLNFQIVDNKTILINNIPAVVKSEYTKKLTTEELPSGAPSGSYLILETNSYIIAVKRSGENTYIGLIKNLVNEGEKNIWWKI